jgi:aminopeptidase YwaD
MEMPVMWSRWKPLHAAVIMLCLVLAARSVGGGFEAAERPLGALTSAAEVRLNAWVHGIGLGQLREPGPAGAAARRRPRPSLAGTEFRPELALGEAAYLCWEVGPRPAGSVAEQRAAAHLLGALRQLGCRVGVQDRIPAGPAGGHTRNVVGDLPGPPGAPRIVLGAHYDTVPRPGVVGANDNASGVGVILEVARALSGRSLPFVLEVVCFGGEERALTGGGLRGSTWYVASGALARTATCRAPVIAMINVDMVGRGSELHAWSASAEPTYLTSLLSRSAQALGVSLDSVGTRLNSDHHPFARAGVPSVWLQSLPDPTNHTPRDRPENLSAATLQRAGRLLVHVLANLEPEDVRLLRDCCANGTQVARRGGR